MTCPVLTYLRLGIDHDLLNTIQLSSLSHDILVGTMLFAFKLLKGVLLKHKKDEVGEDPRNSLCMSRPGDDSELRQFIEQTTHPPLSPLHLLMVFSVVVNFYSSFKTHFTHHLLRSLPNSLPQGEFISPSSIFPEHCLKRCSTSWQDTLYFIFLWLCLPSESGSPSRAGQPCP